MTSAQAHVSLRSFEKEQLKQAKIFTGISPNAMRRVFGGWILFSCVVGIIVAVAPNLSMQFILTTMFVLVAFTLAMFAQSRIAEGWPSIIYLDGEIGVVRDPQLREFICVPVELVKSVEPTIIKPNKKAIAIRLNEDQLTQEDIAVLLQAVWPRDNKVLGLAHFKHRQDACDAISQWIEKVISGKKPK